MQLLVLKVYIDNLSKQKRYSETVFRKNKTIDWVLTLDERGSILEEAFSSQNRIQASQNDKKEDFEMDCRQYNRRLVQPHAKRRKT